MQKIKYFFPVTFLFLSFSIYANREALNTHSFERIYVFGHHHNSTLIDFVPSITELSGEELLLKRETSLGDTLAKETGVSSTGYGPNSSRPVIRGLDGDRIKMLQNGLGTLDASTQSVDHALSVDMLTIDQIEVVRGPMSLLYGSSAVGGVVNILTDRIHRDFDSGFYGKYNVEGQTAQPGSSQSLVLNYGVDYWMIHADISSRNLGELEVPDFARTQQKRDEEARTGEKAGEVQNSFNKQTSGGAGVSRILENGYVGVSYSFLDNEYGTVSEPDVTIGMEQNRYEFHFEHGFEVGPFNNIRFKSAQADYEHTEFEGAAVGTVFKNEGNESRLELDNTNGDLKGISGLQTRINKLAANGDEAFLPSSKTRAISLFSLQDYKQGKNTYSVGTRIESTKIEKEASANFGASREVDYTSLNFSLGYQYKLSDNSSLNQSLSYTERAPTAQELFANGAHIASSTFEVGRDNLKKEEAVAYEINYKYQENQNEYFASVFVQHFDNFIFLNPTGTTDSESSLAVFNYDQIGAFFYGLELSGLTPIAQNGRTNYLLKSSFDYVRAQSSNGKLDLPRITPARLGTGLQVTRNKWRSDLDLRYVFKQSKVANFETRTDSYVMLDLSFHYDFTFYNRGLTVYTKLNNLLDEEARNHVSTIKDVAPLAGRNATLGIQGTF